MDVSDITPNRKPETLKLKVNGMTCGHCAQTVTKAVEPVPSVQRAVVDLEAGEVAVEGNPDEHLVRQAIEGAGYEVEQRRPAP